jgi:P-type conjugative transfer protein TrbJ
MAMAPLHNARAILGVGDIVYDPANHVENIITAIRSLEQINNQVQQLANEARMLINQARNLTSLPTTIAPDLQSSLWRIDNLIGAARGIAYDVTAIDAEYQRLFPEDYAAAVTTSQILQDAQEAWALARGGFQHSLNVQAEVVGQIRSDTLLLDRLVASSQSAVGNLQVAQAGNQLTALAAKQSMQLQSLMAASSRADALEKARALAARAQGKARFENFLGDRSAYAPQ